MLVLTLGGCGSGGSDTTATHPTRTSTLSQAECEKSMREEGIPPTATAGCDVVTILDANEP